MALTTLKIFGSIAAPVHNRMPVHISADDNYLKNVGAAAVQELTITTNPNDGDTIILSWGSESVTMTCTSSTPDDSGTEFIEYGGTNDTLGAAIDSQFASNYLLNRDFVITSSTNKLIFTAREKGTGYALTVGGTAVGTSFATTVTGVDISYAQNYSIGLGILVATSWTSGVYERKSSILHRPEDDLVAYFDIHTLLKPYVTTYWPDWNDDALLIATDHVRKFQLEIWEQFGSTAVPHAVTTTNHTCINAGIDHKDFALETLFDLDFFYSKSWMSWRGNTRYVTQKEQIWLGMYDQYTRGVSEDIHLKAKVYYDDATDSTTTLISDPDSGLATDQIGLWPAGFLQNELETVQPAKTATKYEIWVENDSAVKLTDVVTFHLVDDTYNDIYFEFLNSFRIVESLRCKGAWEVGTEVSQEELEQWLPNNYTADQIGTKRQVRYAQNVLKCSTGFMSKAQLLPLVDFLLSEELKYLDYDLELKVGCVLQAETWRLISRGNEDENLYAFNFTILKGERETNYSAQYAP